VQPILFTGWIHEFFSGSPDNERLTPMSVVERGSAATGITWRSMGCPEQPLLAFFIVDRDG